MKAGIHIRTVIFMNYRMSTLFWHRLVSVNSFLAPKIFAPILKYFICFNFLEFFLWRFHFFFIRDFDYLFGRIRFLLKHSQFNIFQFCFCKFRVLF